MAMLPPARFLTPKLVELDAELDRVSAELQAAHKDAGRVNKDALMVEARRADADARATAARLGKPAPKKSAVAELEEQRRAAQDRIEALELAVRQVRRDIRRQIKADGDELTRVAAEQLDASSDAYLAAVDALERVRGEFRAAVAAVGYFGRLLDPNVSRESKALAAYHGGGGEKEMRGATGHRVQYVPEALAVMRKEAAEKGRPPEVVRHPDPAVPARPSPFDGHW